MFNLKKQTNNLKYLFQNKINLILLKYLTFNTFIYKKIRNFFTIKFKNILHFESKIPNICIITGKSKSISKKFKISRHILKKYIDAGLTTSLKHSN